MEATMTNDDSKRATWDIYAAAWKEPTAQGKQAALAASVSPACTYRDPLTQFEGHAALIEGMLDFHRQVPGGHFETTYFLAHHDRSIARWNMRTGDGVVAAEGITYGEYDARGKLVTMTGFFDVPAQ
jgi:SnoaL-like domain